MAFRAFIVEDEPPSRERLRHLLAEYPDIEVIGEAGDGLQAVEMINRLRPELVFLDIRLPGLDGFEVLAKLTVQPRVVFVTAYDQYAVRAFEENAIDYLLKPTSRERLTVTMERVRAEPRGLDEAAVRCLQELFIQKRSLRRFSVTIGNEILIIPEDEVYFFKAADKYVFLHTRNRNFIIDMTLKELEQTLDPARFCRIHKSTIVAMDRVDRLKKWFHGDYVLLAADQARTRLKVSRNYLSALREKLRF